MSSEDTEENITTDAMDVTIDDESRMAVTENTNVSDLMNQEFEQRGSSVTIINTIKQEEEDKAMDDFIIDSVEFQSENIIEEVIVVSKEQAEFTSKFLNGELTFSEYTQLMEGNTGDEVDITDVDDSTPIPAIQFEPSTSGNIEKKSEKQSGSDIRRPRRALPPTLEGLMGEAHLRYARGDKETAQKMCFEIIRQAPTAPEPFDTLSFIYEELGFPDKSLQCALIAAYLRPRDVDKWIHLAEMSEEQGDIKQAITCYSKAISASPQNIDLYLKRGSLLEVTGDRKLALKGYTRLLEVVSCNNENMQQVLDIAKMLAQKFYEDGELLKARDTLEIAFKKCAPVVSLEECNLMLELLTSLKEYKRCVEVFSEFCGIEFETESRFSVNDIDSLSEFKIISCKIPDDLVVDIYVKLVVVLIHLRALHLIDEFMSFILNDQNPEETGDLFLDVAEALMSEGMYNKALLFLSPLVHSQNYSLAAVWLRHAECLKICGQTENAVESYKMVVGLAPQHLDARILLSGLLRELGHWEEAINVLEQNAETEILDPRLLYEKCLLLKKSNRVQEFLSCGQLLLSRHCVHIRHVEEIHALTRQRRYDKKTEALNEIRTLLQGETMSDVEVPSFTDRSNAPTVDEEFELLRDLCEFCLQQKQFALFQRLTFSALGSKKFHSDISKICEIEFLSILSSLYNNDTFNAYNLARDHLLRDLNSNRAWNLLNLVIQRSDDGRHNRFIMRLLFKNQNSKALSILHANNCLVSGTYKYALNEYVSTYNRDQDPMLAFLVSVTLFQMSCQKFCSKRHALIVQGLAFMSIYQEKRGKEFYQETCYNLGRIFHQLGLLPAAIYHYNLALNSNCSVSKSDTYNLKREIAFNLHLIYLKSGARDLARSYIDKYVII